MRERGGLFAPFPALLPSASELPPTSNGNTETEQGTEHAVNKQFDVPSYW